MNNVLILWLRHHHIPLISGIGVTLPLLIRVLVRFTLESGGQQVEVATLWVSVAAALPLMFLFVSETEIDRVASRSLLLRRLGLLSIVVAVAMVAAIACYPNHVADYGSLAVFRNIVALVGLGLLSVAILPVGAIWVVPTCAALASWMFSWPLYPSLAHSLWGALRAPGVIRMYGGALDLSVALSLAVALAGGSVFLAGVDARGILTNSVVSPTSVNSVRESCRRPYSLRRRGLLRAALLAPVSLILCLLTIWIVFGDPGDWGGSPRLLLSEVVPSTMFMLVPLSVMAGVVCGQARWRSGVVTWERLSDRGGFGVTIRAVLIPMGGVFVAISLPILLAAVVAAGQLLVYGVSPGVTGHELRVGAWRTLATLGAALLGAIVGALAGRLVRGIWCAPLSLVLALAVCVAMPRFDDYEVDREMAAEYGYTICTTISTSTTDVKVCAAQPDRGYLPAASDAVREIYRQAARPGVLPRTVRVVDNLSRTVLLGDSGPTSQPAVGLSTERGIVHPPRTLDSYHTLEALTNTTWAWCRGTNIDDVRALFSPGPLGKSATMSATVRALERCRG